MSGSQVLTIFAVAVVALLIVDLFVVHRRGVTVTIRSALTWSVIWVGAAVAFGLLVMPHYADGAVGDYFGAYLVEKALSVDNVFLWLVVLTSLGVPRNAQRRVLLYGVLGAVVLRFGAVNAGVAIMETFTWVLWIAGAFLIVAGINMWRQRHEEPDDGEDAGNPALARVVGKVLRTTDGFRGERFVVREGGRLVATPLLLAVILVELTDIVMALDALPAVLSISTDVVVATCATGFALLGLRAMFYLLSGVAERLRYLKVAVAVILVYIGGTLIIENLIETYHASTAQSLAVIGVVLLAAIVASLRAEQAVVAADEPACATDSVDVPNSVEASGPADGTGRAEAAEPSDASDLASRPASSPKE